MTRIAFFQLSIFAAQAHGLVTNHSIFSSLTNVRACKLKKCEDIAKGLMSEIPTTDSHTNFPLFTVNEANKLCKIFQSRKRIKIIRKLQLGYDECNCVTVANVDRKQYRLNIKNIALQLPSYCKEKENMWHAGNVETAKYMDKKSNTKLIKYTKSGDGRVCFQAFWRRFDKRIGMPYLTRQDVSLMCQQSYKACYDCLSKADIPSPMGVLFRDHILKKIGIMDILHLKKSFQALCSAWRHSQIVGFDKIQVEDVKRCDKALNDNFWAMLDANIPAQECFESARGTPLNEFTTAWTVADQTTACMGAKRICHSYLSIQSLETEGQHVPPACMIYNGDLNVFVLQKEDPMTCEKLIDEHAYAPAMYRPLCKLDTWQRFEQRFGSSLRICFDSIKKNPMEVGIATRGYAQSILHRRTFCPVKKLELAYAHIGHSECSIYIGKPSTKEFVINLQDIFKLREKLLPLLPYTDIDLKPCTDHNKMLSEKAKWCFGSARYDVVADEILQYRHVYNMCLSNQCQPFLLELEERMDSDCVLHIRYINKDIVNLKEFKLEFNSTCKHIPKEYNILDEQSTRSCKKNHRHSLNEVEEIKACFEAARYDLVSPPGPFVYHYVVKMRNLDACTGIARKVKASLRDKLDNCYEAGNFVFMGVKCKYRTINFHSFIAAMESDGGEGISEITSA